MDKDLLSVLEDRWTSLAETIQRLRDDNSALQDKINDFEALCTSQDDQLAELRKEVEELQQEKARTIGRIEGLLARFDSVES